MYSISLVLKLRPVAQKSMGQGLQGYAITFWKEWNYEFSYTDFLSLKEKGCLFKSDLTLPLVNPTYEILCAVLTQGREDKEIVKIIEYTHSKLQNKYVEMKFQLDATDGSLLQNLLFTQHVSGIIMPIIRSSRVLYRWLLLVVLGALVFKLSV